MDKEINARTQVIIDNLMPWDIYFHSESMKCDVCLEGGKKGFGKMTVYDVENEIRNGNSLFCGVDGLGGHAPSRIVDDDIYKFLFNVDKRSPQMTKDVLEGVFKCKTRAKLDEYLKANFVTRGEKKALSVFTAWLDDEKLASLPYFFQTDIDAHVKSETETPTENTFFTSPLMQKPVF